MVSIEICIGSACYVKGSSQVVKELNDLVVENGWQDKVEVKGSFCMKSCQNKWGLGIRVNGKQLKGVTMQNAREMLKTEITSALA